MLGLAIIASGMREAVAVKMLNTRYEICGNTLQN